MSIARFNGGSGAMAWFGINIAILAFALTATVALPANAACRRADLAGLWDAYAIADDFGLGYWQRCMVRFNSRGRVLSGSVCRDDQGNRSQLTGQIVVRRGCRASGTLTNTFSNGVSGACAVDTTLAPNKEVAAGVGRCDAGEIFLFTLVRR